jgi:hypothetical protein
MHKVTMHDMRMSTVGLHGVGVSYMHVPGIGVFGMGVHKHYFFRHDFCNAMKVVLTYKILETKTHLQ